jgi:asparagine synthase (glutamine-hydrolysing)
LADHNLNYTDKLSMAHGIEVRVPYLDKDLVELTTQIPISLKMKGQTTKFILRKIAEKYLPKDIIYRSKSGFGSPVRQLIGHELKEFVDDRLSKVRLDDQNIFNVDEVHKLIKDNLEQKVDGSYIILSLLAIESVLRQFR